jgi:hypothetical protein
VLQLDGYQISVRHDGRQHVTPMLKRHMKAGGQPPPPVDWTAKAMASISRMYLNDNYGCCVISSAYHQVGVWTGNDSDSGGICVGTDQEVLSTYRIWNPGRQDNGCDIPTVLDYGVQHGFSLAGKIHKLDGYVAIDWTNKLEVQTAITAFGTVKLGINLPSAWEGGGDGSIWDVTNSGIVGGHDVPAFGFNEQGVKIATWAGTRIITWAAFLQKRWLEEAFVPLSPDWYNSDQLAPNGINAATLKADLIAFGQGQIPDITPTPPPGPPSPPAPGTKVGTITVPAAGTYDIYTQGGVIVVG